MFELLFVVAILFIVYKYIAFIIMCLTTEKYDEAVSLIFIACVVIYFIT